MTFTSGFALYIHIPFCKKACHYCDFHFSTSLAKKEEMVAAICKELILRKSELKGDVQTIYFGGGTPSLLSSEDLDRIFQTIYQHYSVSKTPEITLEANPDDLTYERLKRLASSPINRLSIGVQSFFEQDLVMMNRAHNAKEALDSIRLAKEFFSNLSIDLMYGVPDLSLARWQENLDIAFNLDVPHLSCYALTVEPKTALKYFIEQGRVSAIDEALASKHYELLCEQMELNGYENYEFSNFGKPGFESQNNSAYWFGLPYLGIGPSAHSYDRIKRCWNVSNNNLYIQSITKNQLPLKCEVLTVEDRYNEYLMTALRTKYGLSLSYIQKHFGDSFGLYLLEQAATHLEKGDLELADDCLKLSAKAKFLGDGISSDLFKI